MRVFEAPEQTREAILGKYRQRLERNDKSELKAFDKAIRSGTVRGSGLYHYLNDPVRTLLALLWNNYEVGHRSCDFVW